jgi:transcriptional regulator with XRE-family HTH domain
MAKSRRERRQELRNRMRRFLARVRKPVTYGEVAEKMHTSPMAVGQIMRGIVNDNPKDRKLTRKVIATGRRPSGGRKADRKVA